MAHSAPPAGPAADEARTAPDIDHEFDRDTALAPRGNGEFDAVISGGWSILGAVNGGYLKAILGRALALTLPHPHPFTATAHYLSTPAPGPAVLRTTLLRAGRTLSTGTASLLQTDEHGAEVERVRMTATYGDLDALSQHVATTATAPHVAPYEQCVAMDAAGGPGALGDIPIVERLASRLDPDSTGWALGRPSGRGRMAGWFAFADGREHDALSLLLVGDAMPPAAFDLGTIGWTPTVELTTHVRARPEPGPLRVLVATRNPAGGFLEEDAEVWDSADRLVAQSRQLARMPRPAAG
ncbi:thioesterase family protein [Streptomyces spiramenti]|uniref:Thioesterase family protein n=1 Tax=Streptomyces spiramenti TaxID=2720606 RepID=A0ABX1AN72_9ACTN|nr:thioesterase family protein [Streptomyces spiramenti]NJP67136.1 thioesterase family protein [Streptomyces spiramenti]